MRLTLLKSKLHRLTVTEAEIDYEGSFTLDEDLMDLAGLVHHERIELYDVTNGSRVATYVIPGPRGSRVACANGAAAHLIRRGDVVILAAYADFDATEARGHEPTVVLMGAGNEVREMRRERAGARC
jgi:aspartate 1-decarboxylase